MVSRHRSLSTTAAALKLHVYDHCMFCSRTRLVMGWLRIPYEQVTYGFGEGASEEMCASGHGHRPWGGPVPLTGKKMLPVLEGAGVPAPPGMRGLPESLEICSYAVAISRGERRVSPATGRGDVAAWFKRCREVGVQLHRPRIVQMPVKDFADPRDVACFAYHVKMPDGFDYEAVEASTPELLGQMGAVLRDLEPLLRGTTEEGIPCLNAWGFGMDDVSILCYMRNLTCVKGLAWPARVRDYVERTCAEAGMSVYSAHAC